jgi:hypothetical protein
MVQRYARYVLWLVMIAVGVVLIVDILYLLNGSLEQFPTEEQENKVRTVTAVIALLLSVTELGLWSLLRHLERPNTMQ